MAWPGPTLIILTMLWISMPHFSSIYSHIFCHSDPTFMIFSAAAAASLFSHVWLCATSYTTAYQAPPSLGFSRQEHWSGLPLPSPRGSGDRRKWLNCVHLERVRAQSGTRPGLECSWPWQWGRACGHNRVIQAWLTGICSDEQSHFGGGAPSPQLFMKMQWEHRHVRGWKERHDAKYYRQLANSPQPPCSSLPSHCLHMGLKHMPFFYCHDDLYHRDDLHSLTLSKGD